METVEQSGLLRFRRFLRGPLKVRGSGAAQMGGLMYVGRRHTV